MANPSGSFSPSGVWIADDFRDNLIIDRYDPVFTTMRASKRKHLRSQNSEDAVTWNVFRSLRQIGINAWFDSLASEAFSGGAPGLESQATISLWVSAPPPPSLLADGDEGISEIDVVIESTSWVWFIEAKYRSDISKGTTTRPERNQILRNIDVGSFYAGVRDFYFSLLVDSPRYSPEGARIIEEYQDLAILRSRLANHRPDGLRNLCAVSLLTWESLAGVLVAASKAPRYDERGYAERALAWLAGKGIASQRA